MSKTRSQTVAHFNRVLKKAENRAWELEPKLAAAIEPLLVDAGNRAADNFERMATDHLTAALIAEDSWVLASTSDPRALVRSLALRASGTPGVTSTSTMIAVKPRREEADALAIDGGLDPEDLHVTLAYLGDYEGDLQDLADALADVAAAHAPLEGKVGGRAVFAGSDDEAPSVLLPSVPGLVELRVDVTNALLTASQEFGREHGFVPHTTVAYAGDDGLEASRDLLGLPLHFDSLWVVRGDVDTIEIPFTGTKPLTASLAEALDLEDPFTDALIEAMCEPIEDPDRACASEIFIIRMSQEQIDAIKAGDVSDVPLIAAAHPQWSSPAGDEILDVEGLVASLRTKTDPIRMAVIETTARPALDDVGIEYDTTNPFTRKVLAQTGSQITEISKTTQLNVMRIVRESYDQGLSIPDTATAIRVGMTEAAPARATLIARTELAGAVNGGSLAATQIFDQSVPGGSGLMKSWLVSPGAKFPRHEEYDGLDGQTTTLDGYFDVGGFQLQFPGDPDGPPEEICNCFPGETSVIAPGLQMGFRRWYDGPLVRVETDGQHSLAGTPNHPVLTNTGWKPLSLLSEGDYLVSARLREHEAAVDPDVDHVEAPIEDVFGALAARRMPRRIAGRSMQFHGDGVSNAEVEVVASDGTLRGSVDATLRDHAAQLALTRTGEPTALLTPSGLRFSLGVRDVAAASGDVRGSRETRALVVAGVGHADAHGSGAIATLDTEIVEDSTDSSAVDPMLFAESLYGDAFEVALTEIVRIKWEIFSGHVFNLQTESGTYQSNGIISHNCRCTMIYEEGGQTVAEADAESGAPPDIPTADEDAPTGEAALADQVEALALTDVGGGEAAADDALLEAATIETPVAEPAFFDDVSVGTGAPVLRETVETIHRLKLNEGGVEAEPGPAAKAILGDAKDTDSLYRPGGPGTPYDERRLPLHREIEDAHFEGKNPAPEGQTPQAFFTSGGGASGKGSATFIDATGRELTLEELNASPDYVVIDPDRIKKMLPEYKRVQEAGDPSAASVVHEESSQLAKDITARALADGYNVVIDTTGSGSNFAGKLLQAADAGYDVQVTMFSIPTNEAIVRSIARAERVGGSSFGRYVRVNPLKDAHRNASVQLEKWKDLEAVQDWRVFENSGTTPELVAEKKNGVITILNPEKWHQIIAKGTE